MGEQQADDGKALIRVSDADRRETADRLTLAHDEGRLSLAEYDQRLQGAYAATVRADLDALVADLPAVKRKHLPTVRAQKTETEKAEATREYVKEWRSWAGTAVLLTAIWAVISLAVGDPIFYWPVFPIGIWGAVLVAQLIRGRDDD
jgi:hypothetical protein